ncbi:hypothetical protein [Paracoccus sp. ME4]|uniref:hypothetical protein n=1 Tax=Paracoccus sp. ME4 TaxID=3138066 RepID=UPI00398A8C64
MGRLIRIWWDGERWPKWPRWLGYLWLLVSMGPLFALTLGWGPLVLTWPTGPVIVSSIAYCLIGAVLLIPLRRGRVAKTSSQRLLERIGLWIVTPIMLMLGGYSAAIAGLPLAAAVLTGGPTEVILKTDGAAGGSGRYCVQSVAFLDLVPPFHRICRAPIEAVIQLKSDRTVIVTGWGTEAVMIARDIRLAD